MLFHSASGQSAPAGLVAAYSFDQGSGATLADGSGNGNDGVINGATWTTAGRYGGALSFNGSSSYVDLGNSASLQITGSMTWSAWVFATGTPPDDGQIVAKSGDGDGTGGWQFKSSPDTGPHTFGVAVSNDGSASAQRYSTTVRQLNTWYYVAGVYNAQARTLDIYVNGVLDDGVLSGTVPASQFDSSENVTIGSRTGGFYFQGRIDELRLYNRALTTAEIQADMNAPVSPSTDTHAPTVGITTPVENARVSDIVNVNATASDDVGMAGVQFFVDGVAVGAEDLDAPYGLAWDTRQTTNGAHALTARARDAAGNTTMSSPVNVNVANTGTFQNEVLATGFDLPTSLEFLPDGRMLVVELGGTIKVMSPPYTQADPEPFLQLTNIGSPGALQGIYDIVLDPDFTTNHYYYVSYTLGTPDRDRLSRFTANSSLTGTVDGSEVVLYQDPQDAGPDHHGGALNFGNDGKLYFTTGENFDASASQSLTNPRGKIHRINKDGTAPSDNPFYDGAGPNIDSIWALGLRNPFRAYYDAPTGRLLVGDVGGNDYSTAYEEIDLGARGANYGWPNCESNCAPRYTDPIYSYPHLGRDASVTGGFVYHGSQFPSAYVGSYFFADYTQNWIRRLTFDANGNVNGVYNFEPADGSVDGPYGDIVYLAEGPDGALYYVDLGYSDIGGTFGVSKIRRIRFVDSNQAPTAVASSDTTAGPAPLTVNFSSSGSADPEGQPLTYSWTFGDGSTSTAANPTHTYTRAGQYTARLSVSDGSSTTLSTPIVIRAGTPPTATITSPTDGSTFRAGDVISFSGGGTDAEDGALPASAFTWNIDFLHEGHVHPGLPQTGVKSGSFTIPASGHDFSGNTRYRIALTVTDSDGLTTTSSVIIWPQKVNVTVSTVPAGLTVYLDGIAKVTPFVYDALKGFHDTVNAPDQASGGTSYTFSSWSDGGAQSHEFVVPETDQSLVARFQPAAAPPPVAAYGFDQGSGATLADSSGNGNNGVINGATWTTAGRYGGALSFDGSSSYVDLGNPASLKITGSMTWSAWVYATGDPPDDGQIVAKSGDGGGSGGWRLKSSPDTGPHTFGIAVSSDGSTNAQRYSTTVRELNTWYYVTGVYNAQARTLDIYVNGVLDNGVLRGTIPASQFDPAQNVNIGRRGGGFYFQGRIDELRIYNRALTAGQIQADMATPITPTAPDTQEPTAPTGLATTVVGQNQINLAWTASTDNVGVTGYRVERCQGIGCTNFAQIATPTGTTYNDTGLIAGTTYSYKVRAVDAAANPSGYSNIATAATTAADTQPPTAPSGLTPSVAGTSQINLAWTASTDDLGVTGYQLERCQGAGCSSFAPLATPSGTSYGDTGLASATSYSYRVRAVDAAGNPSGYSNTATAATQAGPSGLVASYSFNEGTGTTLTDSSGGSDGTISGATWTTAGKYGNALTFDGTSDYVDLGNPAALKITGSMSWSAWVYATGTPLDDGQIVAKSGGGSRGWQLKTSPDTGPHTFGVAVSIDGTSSAQRYSTTVRQLNTWYYVAGVYDAQAQTLDIYVNGVLDNGILRGTVPASQFDANQNVNIGRRGGGFYFQGSIDEMRIYNRAITAAQVQADMTSPIILPSADTQAPTAPTGLAASAAGSSQVNLTWTGSTDNVGVTAYQVERCQDAGCSSFAPVGTATGASFGDTGLASSTSYSYRVRAVDAAGNPSGYSNTASATTQAGPSGLVAAYSFNEGTGTTLTDSSGTGNDGVVSGATWTTSGKNGGALVFDGTSSYVDLGNPVPLRITGSMTWSAWVYATGTPADDGQIVAKSGGSGSGSGGWQLKTSPDAGPHTFGVAVSGDGNTNAQRYSTTVRQLNTWYFVTGVYNAAARTLDIYVNGILDNGVLRGTIPAAQFDPNQSVTIGRRSGGLYFQGRIDDLRIYNRALTPAQVLTDMNTPVG